MNESLSPKSHDAFDFGSDYLDIEREAEKLASSERPIKPSLMRKIVRTALDAMNVVVPHLAEKWRRQISQEEKIEKRAQEKRQEWKERRELEAEWRRQEEEAAIMKAEKEKKEFAKEQEAFESEFIEKTSNSFLLARETRSNERLQEIAERDLNKDLSKLEDIISCANVDGTGVVNRIEHSKYGDVKVYTIDGDLFPYSGIIRQINFKGGCEEIETTENPQAEGMSTSYESIASNNAHGLLSDNFGAVFYGYDHITPNTIIDIKDGHLGGGGTSQAKRPVMGVKSTKYITYLNNGNNGYQPNEIYMKRRDEDGRAILPDYMFSRNNMYLNEETFKRAAHFNIPVVNVIRRDLQ